VDDEPFEVEVVAKEGIRWHCGITLQGGKCVVVGYLPEEWKAPGDDSMTMPFLTALWAHDGTSALKLVRTAIRVVCANTKRMAEDEAAKTGHELTIRHTKNWQDRIEQARQIMMGLRQSFEEYKELAEELAKVAITEATVDLFLEQFLPMPDISETQFSKRVKNNVFDARASVRKILDGGNGTTAPMHRRTAYGLWQAGLEYLQHVRPTKKAHSKLNRSVLKEERVAENLHELVLAMSKEA